MPLVQAKLVTIVSVFEVRDRVRDALRRLGASGMSIGQVDGEGFHGTKRDGMVDRANAAFNVIASAPLAAEIVAWVERELEPEFPVVVWVADVHALPGSHFA
jgi:nitrogen regulatory protein PII